MPCFSREGNARKETKLADLPEEFHKREPGEPMRDWMERRRKIQKELRKKILQEQIDDEDRSFTIGFVTFYPKHQVCLYKGEQVNLTATEYQICEYLATYPGVPRSHYEICDYIGQDEKTDWYWAAGSHIKRIRRQFSKVSGKTFNPIETRYQLGFFWKGGVVADATHGDR